MRRHSEAALSCGTPAATSPAPIPDAFLFSLSSVHPFTPLLLPLVSLAGPQDIRALLQAWLPLLSAAQFIFLHAPAANRPALFGSAAEHSRCVFAAPAALPANLGPAPPAGAPSLKPVLLSARDQRLQRVPFPTRRPTLKEAKRVAELLARVEVEEVVDTARMGTEGGEGAEAGAGARPADAASTAAQTVSADLGPLQGGIVQQTTGTERRQEAQLRRRDLPAGEGLPAAKADDSADRDGDSDGDSGDEGHMGPREREQGCWETTALHLAAAAG